MNSPGKCTSVVEQKFDFRSFRPGTELISGKPQGSVSVISGLLGEAGNATTGEQKAYCYFATAVLVYILHYYNFLFWLYTYLFIYIEPKKKTKAAYVIPIIYKRSLLYFVYKLYTYVRHIRFYFMILQTIRTKSLEIHKYIQKYFVLLYLRTHVVCTFKKALKARRNKKKRELSTWMSVWEFFLKYFTVHFFYMTT